MDARRTKDFVEHFRATKAGNSTERRSSSGGDDGNTGNILSSASSLAAAAGAPSQHAAGAVAAQSSASTRRDSGSSGGIWGETENDLAAGGAAARLCYCCCSFGMLITSIYCAHNMGAHCASLLPKPRLRPRPCRLHLSTTPAPPATCDACIAGHAAGSAASRFPTAFFPGAFLSFTRPFFLSLFFFLLFLLLLRRCCCLCSCTANSIIVNANFCPIPNPIPLRMFCFSIEESLSLSRRTFSVSAFYLLLIYATLARPSVRSYRAPCHARVEHSKRAPLALFTQTIVEYLPSMLIEFFPVD